MKTNREAGTASVEAVLVTPVLLLLLAVLMAGGKVTSDQAALRAVVREAGRVAVTALPLRKPLRSDAHAPARSPLPMAWTSAPWVSPSSQAPSPEELTSS